MTDFCKPTGNYVLLSPYEQNLHYTLLHGEIKILVHTCIFKQKNNRAWQPTLYVRECTVFLHFGSSTLLLTNVV